MVLIPDKDQVSSEEIHKAAVGVANYKENQDTAQVEQGKDGKGKEREGEGGEDRVEAGDDQVSSAGMRKRERGVTNLMENQETSNEGYGEKEEVATYKAPSGGEEEAGEEEKGEQERAEEEEEGGEAGQKEEEEEEEGEETGEAVVAYHKVNEVRSEQNYRDYDGIANFRVLQGTSSGQEEEDDETEDDEEVDVCCTVNR